MFMRIFSLAPVLLLSACGAATEVTEAPSGGEKLACAVDGATDFAPVCNVERATRAEGLTLTIRHPAGGFRRLLVTKDGRGVIAADGAEVAIVAPVSDGLIEVTLGGDKYRLPATIKGATKAAQ
jgi:hypothetical protein